MAQWRRLEDALQCGCAYLLNTRDRYGNAVIVLQKNNAKWNMEENSIILTFFAKRLSDRSKDKSSDLTVIVDGRDTSFREIQSVLRDIKDALGSQLDKILLVRVESWGQQRLDHCAKSNIYPQPITVSPSRLQNYVQPDVLPKQLGGNMDFNHQKWMESVMGREKLWQEGQAVSLDADKLLLRLREDLGSQPRFSIAGLEGIMEHHRTHYSAAALAITEVLQSGSTFLEREDQDMTEEFGFRKDNSEFPQTKQEIQNLLDELKEKLKAMEEAWKEAEDLLRHLRQVGGLYQRVNKAVTWLLGPAEALLPSNMGIGLDLTAAKDLRKKHELIEVELREKYAEISCLCHDIKLMGNSGEIPQDLNLQKEYMQVLSRRLAAWAEKRRALLIKSSSFYRKVQEALSRVSSTTDYLRSLESRLTNISVVESGLTFIEARHTSIFDIMEHVREESQKLLEHLRQPLLSIKGQEFVPDNMSEYNHVMELSQLTVKTCSHATSLMDNKKLHMQRLWQLWTCEKDAKEAIRWIKEMEELLVECYGAIGTSVEEITQLKFQHRKFEETASQAYEYCNKLLKTSRSLRDVCGRTDQTCIKLQSQLSAIWSSFVQTSQENMTRKCVANVFHRNMDQHLKSLDELYQKMSEDLGTSSEAETRNVQRMYLKEREKLLQEVARTMRLGKLLRSRVKQPILPQIKSTDSSNGAIEAINQKILKAKAKAEELDGLFCSPAVTPESSPTLLRRTKIRRSPTPCQHSPRPERRSPALRPFSPIVRRKSPSSISSSPEPLRKKQASPGLRSTPSKSDDTIRSIKQLNSKVSKALEYMKQPAQFSCNLNKIKQQSRADQIMKAKDSHIFNDKTDRENIFQRNTRNKSPIFPRDSGGSMKRNQDSSITSLEGKDFIKEKTDSTLETDNFHHSGNTKGLSSDSSETESRSNVSKRNAKSSNAHAVRSGTRAENILAKYEGNEAIVVSDENSEILSFDLTHSQGQEKENRLSTKLKRRHAESSQRAEDHRPSLQYSKEQRSFTKSPPTMYNYRYPNKNSKNVKGKNLLTKAIKKHQVPMNATLDTSQLRNPEEHSDSHLPYDLGENVSDKGKEYTKNLRRTPSHNSLPARVRSASPQPSRFFSQENVNQPNFPLIFLRSSKSAVNFNREEFYQTDTTEIPTSQKNVNNLRGDFSSDEKQKHSPSHVPKGSQKLVDHKGGMETPKHERNTESCHGLYQPGYDDGKQTLTIEQSTEAHSFAMNANQFNNLDENQACTFEQRKERKHVNPSFLSTSTSPAEFEQLEEENFAIPQIVVEQYDDSASSIADVTETANGRQTPCFSFMPINGISSPSAEVNTNASSTHEGNEERDEEPSKSSKDTQTNSLQLESFQQRDQLESKHFNMKTDSKQDGFQAQSFEQKIESEEKDLNVEIAFYSSVPIAIQCAPSSLPLHSVTDSKAINRHFPAVTGNKKEGIEGNKFKDIRGAPLYSSLPTRTKRLRSSQAYISNSRDTIEAEEDGYFHEFKDNENEGPSSLCSDTLNEADNYSSLEYAEQANGVNKDNNAIPRSIRISSPQPYIPYTERMCRRGGRGNEFPGELDVTHGKDEPTHLINVRGSLAYSSMPTKMTRPTFLGSSTHQPLKEKRLEFFAEIAAASADMDILKDWKNRQEIRFSSSMPQELVETSVPQTHELLNRKSFQENSLLSNQSNVTADGAEKLSGLKDNRERPCFSSMPVDVNQILSPQSFDTVSENITRRAIDTSKESIDVKSSDLRRGERYYSSLPQRTSSSKSLGQCSDKEKGAAFVGSNTSEDATPNNLKDVCGKPYFFSKPLRVYRSPSPQAHDSKTFPQEKQGNGSVIPIIATHIEQEVNKREKYLYSSMPVQIKPTTSSKPIISISDCNSQDKKGSDKIPATTNEGTQSGVSIEKHLKSFCSPNEVSRSKDQNLQISSKVSISKETAVAFQSNSFQDVLGTPSQTPMSTRVTQSPSPQQYLSSSEQVRQKCDVVVSRLSSMAEIIEKDKSSRLKDKRGKPLYSSMPIRSARASSPKPYMPLSESKSSADIASNEPLCDLKDVRGRNFHSSLPMKIRRSPSPQTYLSSSDEILHHNVTAAVKCETASGLRHVRGEPFYSSMPIRISRTPSPQPNILPPDENPQGRGISPEASFLDVDTNLKSRDAKKLQEESLYSSKAIRISRTPSPQPFIPLKDKEGNPIFPKKRTNSNTDENVTSQGFRKDQFPPVLKDIQSEVTHSIKDEKQLIEKCKGGTKTDSKREQSHLPKPPPRSDSLKRKFSCLLKKYRTAPIPKSKKETRNNCPPPRPSSLPAKVVTFSFHDSQLASSEHPLKRPSESPPLPLQSPSPDSGSVNLTRKLLGLPPRPPKQDKTSKSLSKSLPAAALKKAFHSQRRNTLPLSYKMSKSYSSLGEHEESQTYQSSAEKCKQTLGIRGSEISINKNIEKRTENRKEEKIEDQFTAQLEEGNIKQTDTVQENNEVADEGTPLSSLEYLEFDDDGELPPLESPSLVNIPLFALSPRMPSFSDPSLAIRTPSPVPLADSPSTSDPGWFPVAISSSRPSTPSSFLSIVHFPETKHGEMLEEAMTEKGHEEIEERLMTKELENDYRKIGEDKVNKLEIHDAQETKRYGKKLDTFKEVPRQDQSGKHQLQPTPIDRERNDEEGLRIQQKVLKVSMYLRGARTTDFNSRHRLP